MPPRGKLSQLSRHVDCIAQMLALLSWHRRFLSEGKNWRRPPPSKPRSPALHVCLSSTSLNQLPCSLVLYVCLSSTSSNQLVPGPGPLHLSISTSCSTALCMCLSSTSLNHMVSWPRHWRASIRVEALDSLRGSSIKIGTMHRGLAWPLRKDDTRKSRSVNICVEALVTS